ncbi:MAG TPA: HAD family hydrolase [Firmicutes bacterium]|nr:HAD family hydrolase [Candidatus Fermentithermobacillaceae bacterium]
MSKHRASKPPGILMFDLDGTLLPVGLEFFYNDYPEAAAPYFADIIEPGVFKETLLKSTWDMVNNLDPGLPNIDAFRVSFERRVGQSWNRLWPIFERFYSEEFPRLRRLVPESKVARKVVKECVNQGWEIILATNPLFPESAIRERMRWCGVQDLPWKFITTLEDMHFCKPHVQYYQEIVDCVGLDPKRCIMIGNDMQEDMVASELGIKTLLVEDFCVDRGDSGGSGSFEPDMRGKLADVPEIVLKIYETNRNLHR